MEASGDPRRTAQQVPHKGEGKAGMFKRIRA